MAKEYKSVERRKLIIDLDIRVPASGGQMKRRGREEFDKAVAEAVRRELQRTRRA